MSSVVFDLLCSFKVILGTVNIPLCMFSMETHPPQKIKNKEIQNYPYQPLIGTQISLTVPLSSTTK